MHPILFHVFGIPVYGFGIMVALAFLVGCFWMLHRAEKIGENPDLYMEGFFWIIIAGLVGARVCYLFFFPNLFLKDPIGSILNQGGLVWYGGMIAVTVVAWYFCKIKNISLMRFGDVLAPPAAIGLGIGRIGCLLAGCCFGAPCALPWAIQYPHNHESYPHLVHPSPIYETLAMMLVTGLLLWVDKHKRFEGATTWMFFIFYGFVRFMLEYYRGDRLVWIQALNLSASQVISLLSVVFGFIMLLYLKGKPMQLKKSLVALFVCLSAATWIGYADDDATQDPPDEEAVKSEPVSSNLMLCQKYANDQLKAWGSAKTSKIVLSPVHFTEDKYEAKVGTQFISTILSGNAVVSNTNETPIPVQFMCLLESDKKALFFNTMNPFTSH